MPTIRKYERRNRPSERKDGRKDRSENNKDKWKARRKKLPPGARSGEQYEARYGVTKQWYNETLDKQNGVCAICKSPPKNVRLHVDHNHKTKIVRGILCTKCNTRLHCLEEEDWLKAAQNYLAQHDSQLCCVKSERILLS